jgi:hypothetical protein
MSSVPSGDQSGGYASMSVTCDSPDPFALMTRSAPSPKEPEREATREPSGDHTPNGYPATESLGRARSEPSGRMSDKRLSPPGSEWNTIHGPSRVEGSVGEDGDEIDPSTDEADLAGSAGEP